jgi:hypothetical protein
MRGLVISPFLIIGSESFNRVRRRTTKYFGTNHHVEFWEEFLNFLEAAAEENECTDTRSFDRVVDRG